jgi:hypothetical protein
MVVIILLALIILDAAVQAFLINKQKVWIPHKLTAVIVCSVAILVMLPFLGIGKNLLAGFILYLALRLFLFAPLLSIFRGLPIDYITEEQENVAMIDSFFRKLPKPRYPTILLLNSMFMLICLLTIKYLIYV